MLLAANAVPRKVKLDPVRFDMDLGAIDEAITEKTRLVIVNTPHNPTGRIYDPASLKALAEVLDRASARIGRRIFLLSDEPYRRLRFDGPATVRSGLVRAAPPTSGWVGGLGCRTCPPVRVALPGLATRRSG